MAGGVARRPRSELRWAPSVRRRFWPWLQHPGRSPPARFRKVVTLWPVSGVHQWPVWVSTEDDLMALPEDSDTVVATLRTRRRVAMARTRTARPQQARSSSHYTPSARR